MKRPTLKMPEVKMPAFLTDLYYDLRDRRLLLPLALVLVAIAATPILLGQNSKPKLPPAAEGAIAALKEASRQKTSTLTVVEAKPGLRDYRKRLANRTPTDPFKQRYTAPVLKGAKLNEPKEGEGSESGGSKESQSGESGGSSGEGPGSLPGGASPGGSAPGSGGKPHLVFYSVGIKVRITKSVDGKRQGEPIVRDEVLKQTPLPGAKTPVATYMGPARKGNKTNGKALMLVDNSVKSVEGDARCVSGDEVCQLLEVEPGFPVILTYGDNEARYTINVIKFELVVTGHS